MYSTLNVVSILVICRFVQVYTTSGCETVIVSSLVARLTCVMSWLSSEHVLFSTYYIITFGISRNPAHGNTVSEFFFAILPKKSRIN